MVIHRFTQQLSQWTYWILLCLTSPRPQLVSWNRFPKQPFCQKNFRLPRLTLSIFDFWPALWNEKVEWFTTLKYLKCDLMILNRRWKGWWGFPKHTWTWAMVEIKRTCNLPEAPTTPPNPPHKKKGKLLTSTRSLPCPGVETVSRTQMISVWSPTWKRQASLHGEVLHGEVLHDSWTPAICG